MTVAFVSWLLLQLALLALGALLLGRGGQAPVELRLATSWMAGSTLLHLVLQALDLTSLGWSRGVLVGTLVVVGVASWVLGRASAGSAAESADAAGARRGVEALLPGTVAASAGVAFAALGATYRATASDFVYHWGVKGRRFAERERIDWTYLELPENGFAHPDYPMLVSEQFAALALLAGSWAERVQMLWSAAALGLLLAVGGRCLFAGARPLAASLGTLGLGAGLLAFCAGYYQAGGADLFVALPLVAGAAWLLEAKRCGGGSPLSAEVRRGVAWTAAFAASSKIEGIPLAFVLLALWAWAGRKQLASREPGALRALLTGAAPALLTVGPWWLLAHSRDLFQPTNVGSPNPFRWPIVQEQLLRQLSVEEWHSLPWIVFALPVLLVAARSRPFGLLAAAQLGLFVAVYVSAPVDPVFWIVSSFPRALLQFMPAVLVGLVVLWGDVDSDPDPRRTS